MSRPFRGQESMAAAGEAVKVATTVEPLRQAQAVLLPLCSGLTLEQTALVIRRVTLPPKRRSKKLPETRQRIKAEWAQGAPLRLMPERSPLWQARRGTLWSH